MNLRLFSILFLIFTIFGCSNGGNHIKGKVLKFALKDGVKTSDPTNSYDVVSAEVIDQIYESVLQYNYFSEKIDVIPNLAESMPITSKDGKTVTIKLRKDIKFQDDECFKATAGKGRTVTADDFLYAWKRHANPANESQAFWIWDGKVVGIGEFQKKFTGKPAEEVMKENVEGFKKIDNYTIELKLTKPYPQLIYILTMHFSSPVAREAVEMYGKDFVNHPVGTGPFKARSWNPQSKVILVKNDNFRTELFPDVSKLGAKFQNLKQYSGRKLPFADAIEFDVVKEDQPRWLGFMNGDFDQIQIPKDNFSTAIQNTTDVTPELKAKGITVSIEPAYSFWYVSMNMKDKVIGENKYLRQAIASALDAQSWLKIFKNGRGVTQNEVNPPSVLDRCGKPYRWTYDVARAGKLMEKAGFPNGKGLPILKFDTRGTDQSERQLAEFITKNMAAIGIQIEINANTFPAYLDKMNKGNLQISKGGWMMDYPDAENNMQLLFGPNKAPGPNEANFDNAEYNKLYEQMALMPTSVKRKEMLCKMEEIVQENAPWAYGIFENEYRLVSNRIPAYRTTELILNKYKYLDTTRVE